ncbi:MAG TPA: glycosyltransferase family 2 protein [Candidatus Sabulitectum sp.]|nr:glycosyltransferase family 2 protein [Candidatus Sabulitectum sp.]HPF32601.1 glycosyltransferase family 2 protein [Candidatus Sabulitectum sp.]HPJ27499.1 glycosyltransferase family 2 protein [Candidatus Sabulitectum sp.]HPR21276.1 glycosyltransferase family 2 protein [Candidatus Sabulitectum sp.]
MKTSVIIPHYNGIAILGDCLDSLLAHDRRPDEIIVVDNASTDQSVEMLKARYPQVRLLALLKNTGFTGANNAGISIASGDMIVLLNNDCIVERGWLSALLQRMEDQSIAAVSSSMRNINSLEIMDSAGGELDWMGFSRDVGRGEPFMCHSSAKDLPFPCGGAVIVRRSALPSPDKLFWDDLFIYYEDLDLGFELNRTGWRVVYEPDAVVRHVHSATAGSYSFLKEYSCTRNRLLVLKKHLNRKTFRELTPLILSWHLLWISTSLARGRHSYARAILKGTSDALKKDVAPFEAPIPLECLFMRFAKDAAQQGRAKRLLYGRARHTIRKNAASLKANA